MTEDRIQTAEGRRQKTKDRGQKTVGRCQRADDRGQLTVLGSGIKVQGIFKLIYER